MNRNFLHRALLGRAARCQVSKSGRAARPRVEALEDRISPAVFNVPGDFPTLGLALSNGVANSPDAVNVVVLGTGTFPVVNQKVQPAAGKAGASLTIVGQGADQTIIDAKQQGRALELVQGTIAIRDLTVTGGVVEGDASVPARGGGILIDTADVTLSGVTVRDNAVLGARGAQGVAPADPSQPGTPAKPGQDALGGGIYVGLGSLTMVGCVVSHNTVAGGIGGDGVPAGTPNGAAAGGNGGEAAGGGLYSISLVVNIQDTAFTDNLVHGGDGGNGADGLGGAAGNGGAALGGGLCTRAPVNLFGPTGPNRTVSFGLNRAVGGPGGNGGSISIGLGDASNATGRGSGGTGGRAQGGGAWIGGSRPSNLVGVTFADDSATGGNGGKAPAVVAAQDGGLSGGSGGDGGLAAGGGLYLTFGSVFGGSVEQCKATGGNGGSGGAGDDGRLPDPPYDLYGDGVGGQTGGYGGKGGNGGDASGGGVASPGYLIMVGTLVNLSEATGGAGGAGANAGNGGPGQGGANATYNGFTLSFGPLGGIGGSGGWGGAGGRGGDATGGGVALGTLGPGPFNLVDCLVSDCSVTGGPGAPGGNGGKGGSGGTGGSADPSFVQIVSGVPYYGGPGGDGGKGGLGGNAGNGGRGGHGYGGGVYAAGSDVVIASGLVTSRATGGDGSKSGNAGGGGSGGDGGPGTGSASGTSGMGARGGNGGDAFGGDGGNARGGGLYIKGDVPHATIDPPGLVTPGTLVAGKPGVSGAGGTGATPGSPWLGPYEYEGDPGNGRPGGRGIPAAGAAEGAGTQYGGTAAPPAVVVGPASLLVLSPVPPLVFSGSPIPYPVYVLATDATSASTSAPHIVSSFQGTVDLSVNAPKVDADPVEYNVLGGSPRQKAAHGVAVFNDIRVKNALTDTRLIAVSGTVPSGGNASTFSVVGYSPDQIRKAFGIDRLGKDAKGRPLDGTGQTIAVLVKYHNPRLLDDVDAFDRQYGLDTTYGAASSFIAVRNQYGQAGPLPDSEPGWASEEAMDVEWIHAIAPGAKILVIEADPEGDYFEHLELGVIAANSFANGALSIPGFAPVSVVSMSWGQTEQSIIQGGKNLGTYEDNVDSILYRTPGVTYVAASGDDASPGDWPSFSPNIVSVGGTNLWIRPDGTWSLETEWSRSGYGQSLYQTQPDFQAAVRKLGRRSIPDVEFLATNAPGFGAAVYDSYNGSAKNPWTVPGGTSLGTPCWAALFALVNQGRQALGRPLLNAEDGPKALDAIYGVGQARPQDFHDITFSADGLAGPGFDLRSGWGTPVADRLVPDLIDAGTLKFNESTLKPAMIGAAYVDSITVDTLGGYGPVHVTASIVSASKSATGQFTLQTVNGNTGIVVIKGNPTAAAFPTGSGVLTVRVVATDARGTRATRDYVLKVNSPLRIAETSLRVGVVGRAYSQVISATGGQGLKWVQADRPGAFGLKFRTVTGDPGKLIIEGVPTSSGTVTLVLRPHDATYTGTPVELRLQVNPALTLGNLSRTTWPRNKPGFSAVIPIVGGIGPYQMIITGLPAGLRTSLNTKTGVLTITGKPTQLVNRPKNLTVTAIDAAGYQVTKQYTLIISAK
ncbi:MAG: S53 family peptidase [Isosphaeraceae bacterium]